MRAVVHPSRIGVDGKPAHYSPPPSKSHFQRLCAAALLHDGTTIIQNPGRSEDDAAALLIIEELGASVEPFRDEVRITSTGKVEPRTGVIHCGESGLSARLFAPIAALSSQQIEISGEGSLLKRPMTQTVDSLELLGATVSDFHSTLPFKIKGPIQPKSICIDGSQSSQTVSGALFALAATAAEPITLRAERLVSRPYLEMTCAVLQDFGWNVRFDGQETCFIEPTLQTSRNMQVRTEPDWSSIAPIVVAAAFAGSIEMDFQRKSRQADGTILGILRRANAGMEVNRALTQLWIIPYTLYAFNADCTHSPDLVPILTILATACQGQSRISGLHRLAHKESDRAKTTSNLLTALGITHNIDNDAFTITGPQTPRRATVNGYNDHRIVMAAAIAALRADGPVTIEGAEAVRKSYPAFFDDLQKLGVAVQLQDK